MAEAETQLEACRLLCLKTLWLKDQGLPHTAEAAMCKWWAPKLAFDTIQTCLLLNGHGAYTEECPTHNACETSSACRSETAPRKS